MSARLKDPLLGMHPMQEEDLDAVMAIEMQVYEFPWTLGIFRDCMRVDYCCLTVTMDAQVIGYGVMSVAVEECHILNICIHPVWRGQGLGRKLTSRLLNLGKQQGAESAFLEVRPSNSSALSLYERLGFVAVGRRKDYYPARDGREDALVFSLTL